MNNKIYFSIPGYCSHYRLNMILLKIKKYHQDKFYDDIIIDSIYDCFPGCIWNGGRPPMNNQPVSNQDIEYIMDNFNKREISIRHTFTNSFLSEEHLLDTFGNFILNVSSKTGIKTGITLNSPLLKNYIENKYPNNFYINWSATKCLSDINEINILSKNNLVIPSYQDINNEWDKIQKLQYPENIELIVDESCIDDCVYKSIHYLNLNAYTLFKNNNFKGCPFEKSANYYDKRTKRKHNISIEDIRKKYLPLGINKFKIAGREENDINLIETYINYFVKIEYKDYIRNEFLGSLFENKKTLDNLR